ncbi:hypothetical protein HBH56_238360 [Parastagonospora nodorum]|uniref:Uncharacterized protein n=1 Tax=Phaeosphaeria nodorum (strain SN15 / ATCC MYA-4574 / FGSC 10173) TaxID=321614 RepID=A0A7U2F8F9_PHANO|nr:hypothetical protein HBH56_238360 [Parastagonospora nodorum]QRD00676.1 hypothetical protein JI435_415600 [Parastagonospora nodorum SN15]KAH3925855.1 hypothetical protein HBH54_177150 [Parastagonospora nodorum]KAH3952987.1 hypothetical protein HBH53_038520 [Parastagonospora nodorum]KAH4000346.1 hypothetical protein HBI10_101440 [Parastagonospora nodorum]
MIIITEQPRHSLASALSFMTQRRNTFRLPIRSVAPAPVVAAELRQQQLESPRCGEHASRLFYDHQS